MTARRITRYGSLAYLALILIAPVSLIFYRAFESGFGAFWSAVSNPDAVHALRLTLEVTVVAVPLNTLFGILCSLAIVAHRARAPHPLRISGDPARDDVRVTAVRRARGRAGAARDRHRAGGGGGHARLARARHVPAHHAARDPLRRRLRRRADDRAVSRRVRCGRNRLRRHPGPHADADPVRTGVVRELSADERVRGLRAARRPCRRHARRDDGHPTKGGHAWQSRRVTSRSDSASSWRSTTSRWTWRAARSPRCSARAAAASRRSCA